MSPRFSASLLPLPVWKMSLVFSPNDPRAGRIAVMSARDSRTRTISLHSCRAVAIRSATHWGSSSDFIGITTLRPLKSPPDIVDSPGPMRIATSQSLPWHPGLEVPLVLRASLAAREMDQVAVVRVSRVKSLIAGAAEPDLAERGCRLPLASLAPPNVSPRRDGHSVSYEQVGALRPATRIAEVGGRTSPLARS